MTKANFQDMWSADMVAQRGQRVAFNITAAGILVGVAQQLFRAEDRRVPCWQCVLAPVTRNGGEEGIGGMPAINAPISPLETGLTVVEMVWGGGGVKFRTRFPYPVCGASFSVAGDNIDMRVFPSDFATVFTNATRPAVAGWVQARAIPTSYDPLVIWGGTAQGLANPIPPFARALLVGRDTLAATSTILFTGAGIAMTVAIPATSDVVRIPIPIGATTFTPTPSAGVVECGVELAFT